MIARVWRGVTKPEDAEPYLTFLRESVLGPSREIRGYLGSRVFRRETDSGTEFLVTTYWGSMDAIREFAGDEPERAVIKPGAEALLAEYEESVRHYEVQSNR